MFWRIIVYILVGVLVVFIVLPKVFGLMADLIHRYISHSTSPDSDSLDAKPKDKQGKDAKRS